MKRASFEQAFIREYLRGSIAAKRQVMASHGPALEAAGHMIAASLAKGGKWLICGNGGSAADAQHLAAEMTGRLWKLERPGLSALALTTDSSALTCIGNDYGFDQVFSRQLQALGRPGDVLLGISTSGNSPNVLQALRSARGMGISTLALTGKGGGRLLPLADIALDVPTSFTAHVQECHIAMGHLLCFLVERELNKKGALKARKR
jgi:D-sedoheptulose 7-phosphate isomerase